MASPFKLLGYLLQIIGMGIMFFGFLQLVTGIQKTVGHVTGSISAQSGVLPNSKNISCDPKEDDLCGVDFAQEGATEKIFSQRVYGFIAYLAVGLLLMFIGLALRASEEIGDFLAGLKNKEQRQRVQVGKTRWGGPLGGRPPTGA